MTLSHKFYPLLRIPVTLPWGQVVLNAAASLSSRKGLGKASNKSQ